MGGCEESDIGRRGENGNVRIAKAKRGLGRMMGWFWKLLIILRLLYSYVVYRVSSIPDDDLHTQNEDCCSELGWENQTKRGLTKIRSAFAGIDGLMMGYSYAQMDEPNRPIEGHQKVVRKSEGHQSKIRLAVEEYECGSLESSEIVIRELRISGKLGASEKIALDFLEAKIAVTKRARRDRRS